MDQKEMQAGIQKMQAMVDPWIASLKDPETAQENTLQNLLKVYQGSQYGTDHTAASVSSYTDYQKVFPIKSYPQIKPILDRVMQGETALLLNEEPIGWAITRGTTKGVTKFIPMTPTDMRLRVAAGRAVMNYALQTKRFDIFAGVNLNLNFPSKVGTIEVGDKKIDYGYSSGIYTKFVSQQTPVHSVPSQDQIDALGGGKSMADWNARFELAYQQCRHKKVTLVGGVAPTAIQFGRYIHRQHKKYPHDLWEVIVMTLGSVPGINTRLAPPLNALYGNAAIREIYGATEGMFGQQLDDKRAWSPNYDLFFFEVKIKDVIKPLYLMKPGEMGSLIVSTPVLPRYEIGDLILAFSPPYFRTIGRKDWLTPIKYVWSEFSSFNFGRL
jgi:hypothetical protein